MISLSEFMSRHMISYLILYNDIIYDIMNLLYDSKYDIRLQWTKPPNGDPAAADIISNIIQ